MADGRERSSRHLTPLPEKSFKVAQGDVIGGLIFFGDKPLGIEEGMIGISIDSEPYRAYVKDLIETLEYKTKQHDEPSSELDLSEEGLILKNKARHIPDDHPLIDAYRRLGISNFRGKDESTQNDIIDMVLNDKIHTKKRSFLRKKDVDKFLAFRPHEAHLFHTKYKNVGMGGLVFKHYLDTLQIKNRQHFATKIGKLVDEGNDVFMVKQDGMKLLGGTSPGTRKILKTTMGKKTLGRLLHPVTVTFTAGLSIPLFAVASGILRIGRAINTPISQANSDAIVETLATKIAGMKGFTVQEIETVEGTYPDNTPKIATIVTWAKGCHDLSGKSAGGENTQENVVIMCDSNKGIGLPVKQSEDKNLIEVAKKDDSGTFLAFNIIHKDGTIELIEKGNPKFTQTAKAYDNGLMISEDKIYGFGEALASVISLADRDGIGSQAQNKGVIPIKTKDKNKYGEYTSKFYGFDFGKAFKQPNPLVSSLQDDFWFDNPKGANERFKNISILYDSPLSDKMKGIYLLASLRGQLPEDLRKKVAQEYQEAGDSVFAKKLMTHPGSIGGVDADLKLIDEEINKYSTKLEEAKASGNSATISEFEKYVARLNDVKRFAVDGDEKILEIFSKRVHLTPKQIDLIDCMEKLTADNVSTLSPNKKALLNHIRIERSNKDDRIPWQAVVMGDGHLTLSCDISDPSKRKKILERIDKLDPAIKALLGHPNHDPLRFTISPENFALLQQQLTEEKVANTRGLTYRTIEDKQRVFQLLTARRKIKHGELKVDMPKHMLAAAPNLPPPVFTTPATPTTPITAPQSAHTSVTPIITVTPTASLSIEPVPKQFATVKETQQRRAKSAGYAFSTTAVKEQQSALEPFLEQNKTSVGALKAYLTPNVQTVHSITKVEEKQSFHNANSSLEITFKNKEKNNAETKVYAQNSNNNTLNFAAEKGLPQDDFVFVAKRIAEVAVAMAKPGAEFDLSLAPEHKRVILESAFKEALDKAARANPERFNQETLPKIKMSKEATLSQGGPSIGSR